MYNEHQLTLDIHREEAILKSKKVILTCLGDIRVYESLLTESMDKLSLCQPDDEKQITRLEKEIEKIDKKIDDCKFKIKLAERTIEFA